MPSQNKTPPSGDSQRERREFFRIDDRIGLEVRRLDDAHPGDDPFNNSPLEALKTEFRRLDQDVRAHLASLAERDRLLAGLVKSLNSKVDTLARIIAFEQNPLQPEDWPRVWDDLTGKAAGRGSAGRALSHPKARSNHPSGRPWRRRTWWG